MLPRLIAENRFAVLDLETTGVDTRRDEMVQFAVIQVDFGRPRIRASSYIQPTRDIHPEAMSKHGITWDVLQHAPRLEDVIPELRMLIGDRCLLGFGIKRFDYPLIRRQFAAAGISYSPSVVDVLPWERQLTPKEPGVRLKHNLVAAAERWGVPILEKHDALDDCRMTWNVFCQLALLFPELGDQDLAAVLAVEAIAAPEGVLL